MWISSVTSSLSPCLPIIIISFKTYSNYFLFSFYYLSICGVHTMLHKWSSEDMWGSRVASRVWTQASAWQQTPYPLSYLTGSGAHFKNVLLFNMYVCMPMWLYVHHMYVGAHRNWKRVWGTWNWSYGWLWATWRVLRPNPSCQPELSAL